MTTSRILFAVKVLFSKWNICLIHKKIIDKYSNLEKKNCILEKKKWNPLCLIWNFDTGAVDFFSDHTKCFFLKCAHIFLFHMFAFILF